MAPRPAAAIREIDPPETVDGRPPRTSDLAGIWLEVQGSPGLLVRFSPDGTVAIDDAGRLVDPAVRGTYEVDGNRLTFTVSGGGACVFEDRFAWRGSLSDEGLMHVVHVEEGFGNCRVPIGTEWTFILISPGSAASAQIHGVTSQRARARPRIPNGPAAKWLPGLRSCGSPGGSVSERVFDAETAEPREVAVGRTECGTVLDRKRREMGVGDEVPGGAERLQEFAQEDQVPIAGMDDRRTGLIEPEGYDVERLVRPQRNLEDPGTCAEPEEGK